MSNLCAWCPDNRKSKVLCLGLCRACYQWLKDKQKRPTTSLMNYFYKADRQQSRIDHFQKLSKSRRRKSA